MLSGQLTSVLCMSLLLLRSATASFHGPKGVFPLIQPAFNSPRFSKGPKSERRSSANASNIMDAATGQADAKIPPLRYLGDERLMQPQPPTTREQVQSKEFQDKLAMLPKAMKEYGGIGIAAPQIGWWTRVFCFGIEGTNPRYPDAEGLPLTMWINPELTSSPSSTETCWMWEGCLSVPGMRGWVERPSEVVLSGWDSTGVERDSRHLVGLAARIAQHEFDHLDGVLFTQRVPNQNFLVPQASFDARDGWARDWPSQGSYNTLLGELCDEK